MILEGDNGRTVQREHEGQKESRQRKNERDGLEAGSRGRGCRDDQRRREGGRKRDRDRDKDTEGFKVLKETFNDLYEQGESLAVQGGRWQRQEGKSQGIDNMITLIALSVRPGRDLAMRDHRLPCSACPITMRRSSSSVNGFLFTCRKQQGRATGKSSS